jgi:hypothetical protein
MDDLFQRPLWMMWKYAYPKTEEDKIRHDVGKDGTIYAEGEKAEKNVSHNEVETGQTASNRV